MKTSLVEPDHLNQIQDLKALLDLVRGLTARLEPEDVARRLVLTLTGRWMVSKFAIAAWKEGHQTVLRQKGIELPKLEILKPALATLPEAITVEELPGGILKESLKFQGGVLLLPILSSSPGGDSVIGVVVLGQRRGQLSYSRSDLEFGAGLVAQGAVAFQNSWYFLESVEKEKVEARVESQKHADAIFSALTDTLPGTVLDEKYYLESVIGMGAFGAVYRAVHVNLKSLVAVKIFRPSPNDTPETLERFQLEGVSASRINHPNSIKILDSGISKAGIAYLVMELLNGRTLAKEIQDRSRLSPARCAEILVPICDVLCEAHSMGIVHRDIKPENIFLHQTKKGEVVKLVDFGIAKVFGTTAGNKNLTIKREVLGTPAYMPPERFRGMPYDGRSDIYSLGVLLYEMLTGRLPFEALEHNPYKVAMMHLTEEPEPLRRIDPTISPAVEAVALQALRKNPEDRPTAKGFADKLIQAVRS